MKILSCYPGLMKILLKGLLQAAKTPLDHLSAENLARLLTVRGLAPTSSPFGTNNLLLYFSDTGTVAKQYRNAQMLHLSRR
jgi:hypothetical protein